MAGQKAVEVEIIPSRQLQQVTIVYTQPKEQRGKTVVSCYFFFCELLPLNTISLACSTIFKAAAVLVFVLAIYSSTECINTKHSLPLAVEDEGKLGTKSILTFFDAQQMDNSMFATATSSVIDHIKGSDKDKDELDVQESPWPTYVQLEILYTVAKAVMQTSSNKQSEVVKDDAK